jgi:3-polyprenyl-4-hydroxybenzoate decarboxylase
VTVKEWNNHHAYHEDMEAWGPILRCRLSSPLQATGGCQPYTMIIHPCSVSAFRLYRYCSLRFNGRHFCALANTNPSASAGNVAAGRTADRWRESNDWRLPLCSCSSLTSQMKIVPTTALLNQLCTGLIPNVPPFLPCSQASFPSRRGALMSG